MTHRDLVVDLLHVREADTHHADIDLDGYVVRCEGHQTGRYAERDRVTLLVGTANGLIGGKDRLRTTCTKRNLVEDGKTLTLAQGTVLTPDGRGRVGVLDRLVAVYDNLGACLLVTKLKVGAVDREVRARIDASHTDRHVVANDISHHRADTEIVTLRLDVLDHHEGVVVVGMGRIGDGRTGDHLPFGNKDILQVGDTALADTFGSRE